jgi:NADPH:quinone reductase-like Zn-dependent oxidoreductase
MKALRFSSFADNLQNLSLQKLTDPSIGAGEAKIKVLAACLNPRDVKNVQGKMSLAPLFESGRFKSATSVKRGALAEGYELYSYVAAGNPGKAVFTMAPAD